MRSRPGEEERPRGGGITDGDAARLDHKQVAALRKPVYGMTTPCFLICEVRPKVCYGHLVFTDATLTYLPHNNVSRDSSIH